MFTRDSKILSHRLTTPLTSVANAVGDVFKPTTIDMIIRPLFANGEQGFFYDPNDLSTMFQDAAGTMPVTGAGQAVGLILDKSRGLVLGGEMVVNGDFSDDLTGWVEVLTAAGTVKIVNGTAELSAVGVGAIARLRKLLTVSAGTWYKVQVTVTGNTSASTVLQLGSVNGATDYGNFALVSGKNTFHVYVSGTNLHVQFYKGANNGTVYVDNFSIKSISGNHAYQTTSSMRPLLVASPQRLDFDTVDDKLITNLPAQLTGCTVVRAIPNVGTQILTSQTIPTPYNDNTDHCGLIVINRALTATETSQITKLFNKAAGV